MLKLTKLREVSRNDLFPSADMVVSMSREFGVPLTAEDFGGELFFLKPIGLWFQFSLVSLHFLNNLL